MYTIAVDVILSIVFIVFLFNVRKLLINIRHSVWSISERVENIELDYAKDNTVQIILTKRMKRAVKRGDNPTFRLLKHAYGNYILVQE